MAEQDDKPPANGGGKQRKWNNNKKGKRNGNKPAQPKFQGGNGKLNGHYFDDSGYGQAHKFVKTSEQIANHVGQDYNMGGGTTRKEVITQTVVVIKLPDKPKGAAIYESDGSTIKGYEDADKFDVIDYTSAKKLADAQIEVQKNNHHKVYSLVWEHCTESMHAKIKSHRDFPDIEDGQHGIKLLRVIKLICFNIEDEKYAPQKVHEAKAAFYALKQRNDSDQTYYTKFTNTVQVIEQCGACMDEDTLTRITVCRDLGYALDTKSPVEKAEITKTVRDYTLAVALILGADEARYSGLIRGLKNASLANRDEWPKTLVDAYKYLCQWESDVNPSAQGSSDYEGVAFNQDAYARGPLPHHAKLICRKCNQKGHIQIFCEDQKVSSANVQDGEVHEEATQEMIFAEDMDIDYQANLFMTDCENHENRSVSFQVNDGINGGRIPKGWVLLDNQSTADVFSNADLLKNIHEVKGSLTIHTQAGKIVTRLKGTVPGYGEVWYCPEGIANILSLSNVIQQRDVEFDSKNGNQFVVTKKEDGSIKVFKKSQHGLYYYDMNQLKSPA
jgi:hypothetical protein